MLEIDGGLNLEETKLTLGLPGVDLRKAKASIFKSGSKRGFSETVDLSLGNSSLSAVDEDCSKLETDVSSEAKSPAAIDQEHVVGWPPVRASRKINATTKTSSGYKYVKVAVDGAPYLRKVDLEMYNSYHHLLIALEGLFSFLTIRNYLGERTIMDHMNGMEYVPTYEDKDGDWMLVGDVPWK
ncbi:hypothetical protein ACFE04_031870 [Oxalis oulophora]